MQEQCLFLHNKINACERTKILALLFSQCWAHVIYNFDSNTTTRISLVKQTVWRGTKPEFEGRCRSSRRLPHLCLRWPRCFRLYTGMATRSGPLVRPSPRISEQNWNSIASWKVSGQHVCSSYRQIELCLKGFVEFPHISEKNWSKYHHGALGFILVATLNKTRISWATERSQSIALKLWPPN